jgi:hypothetical protein
MRLKCRAFIKERLRQLQQQQLFYERPRLFQLYKQAIADEEFDEDELMENQIFNFKNAKNDEDDDDDDDDDLPMMNLSLYDYEPASASIKASFVTSSTDKAASMRRQVLNHRKQTNP